MRNQLKRPGPRFVNCSTERSGDLATVCKVLSYAGRNFWVVKSKKFTTGNGFAMIDRTPNEFHHDTRCRWIMRIRARYAHPQP